MARWYLDVAEATEGAALRRHGTIVAALAESEKLLALLESQLETMADQKVRAATSVATLALADELVEVADAYLASTTHWPRFAPARWRSAWKRMVWQCSRPRR